MITMSIDPDLRHTPAYGSLTPAVVDAPTPAKRTRCRVKSSGAVETERKVTGREASTLTRLNDSLYKSRR